MNETGGPGQQVRLALDVSSGDHGAPVLLAAARDAVAADENLALLLVGVQEDLAAVTANERESGRYACHPCETVLTPDVGPVTAIRQGAASSLGRALQLVAEGQADASVSAGSTTALVALGMKFLGMLPGIRRPALMSAIPTASGTTSLLDLGANLNVDALQLVQFAIMGAVAHEQGSGRQPSVGLLNVGHEDRKGHSVVREAHEQLKQLPLDYRGFIEGNDIFQGKVDVAVCDGFAGNLVLKSSEGLARMLMGELRNSLSTGWRARLGGALVAPSLRGMLARFDPAQHNGAPLLGLNGVVVKSHGSADRRATLQAIREATMEAKRQIPATIRTLVHNYKAEAIT